MHQMRHYLRVIEEDESVNVEWLKAYRRHGGRFAFWERADGEAMCEAITWVEGWLELRRQTPFVERVRVSLRGLRRELECELWP